MLSIIIVLWFKNIRFISYLTWQAKLSSVESNKISIYVTKSSKKKKKLHFRLSNF